ncbi:MAG: hypothetical protein CSA62_04660 [Planctomycetota bacterium]|nr:MAG: hypothetical protein CSA62_04660 [Planctomycetota bacterium]
MSNAKTQITSCGGFTLIEVLIAIAITSMVMTLVLSVFTVTLESRDTVKALGEPMTTGPRILDMIEDDLQAIWTFNIKDGNVLIGENRDIAGDETDRLHFLTGGKTVYPVRQSDDSYRPAYVAEISYLVKPAEGGKLYELWRREDPLVDDDIKTGGGYLLLTNRLSREGFRITYFEEIGKEAEELNEWNCAERGRLPRRIRIEFAIERSGSTHGDLDGLEVNELGGRVLRYHRDIVLDNDTVMALSPGYALLPKIPTREPELETAQAGGGAAAGPPGTTPSAGPGTPASDRSGGKTTRAAGDGKRPGTPGLPGAGDVPIPGVGDIIRRFGGAGGGGGKR